MSTEDWAALGTWVTGLLSASAGMLGALGTWATGAATAFIAWQAYRFTSRADRDRNEVDHHATAAYAHACKLEIADLRTMAEAFAVHISAALKSDDSAQRYGALMAFITMPSFEPSARITSSPSIGRLDPSVSQSLNKVMTAASAAERLRKGVLTVARELDADEILEPRIPAFLKPAEELMTAFIRQAVETDEVLAAAIEFHVNAAKGSPATGRGK
ncbi:hypothetical protein ACFFGH_06415 [Lysobacter korlensis]|uniref:Uncharacterized protein n=1 Tax=Lysobacter korlensis TaxID=553636 RepID=A0ABV6RKH1_9GAMM